MISFADIMRKVLTETMSFRDLLRRSDSARKDRARHIRTKSLGVTTMDGNEAWRFSYKSDPGWSTTGQRWRGHIIFFKEDVSNKESAMDLQCMSDCSCPDFRYRWAYRNAEAGVAPIGSNSLNQNNGRPPRPYNDLGVGACIAKGELILIKNGFVPVEEISVGNEVWTLDGWKRVLNAEKTGDKNIIEICLRSGKKIKVTPEHKILSFSENGGFKWLEAKNLNCSNFLCVCFPDDTLSEYQYFNIQEYKGDKIYYPSNTIKMDETLAELVGYMVAEGSKNGIFSNYDKRLNNDFYNKWCNVFGPKSCIIRKEGCYVGIHGAKVLEQLGFVCGSYFKCVPTWIMRGNKKIIISFLRGCYAGDGNFRNNHSTYATVSKELAIEIHLLLNFIGVNPTLKNFRGGIKKSFIWTVRTSSEEETKKLYNLLNPIRGYSRIENYSNIIGYSRHNFLINRIYRFFRKIISESIPKCTDNKIVPVYDIEKYIPWINSTYKSKLAMLLYKKGLIKKQTSTPECKFRTMAFLSDIYDILKKYQVEKIIQKLNLKKRSNLYKINKNKLSTPINILQNILPKAYDKIKLLYRDDVSFDQVVSINNLNETTEVYDLEIDTSEHFTVNGVIVHNCKHLISLSEYLRTKIEPTAPEPPEEVPVKVPEPPKLAIKPSMPSVPSRKVGAAPEPSSYSDTRAGGLLEMKGSLFERIERFVKENPQFEVLYEDEEE